MASEQMLSVLTVVLTILPAIATATEFVVGDKKGWRPGFDYADWTQGKKFKVGDTLVFKYTSGKHNVIKVGGEDFQGCQVPNTSEPPLTTGNDVITLASPGRKWYICGVGNHCVIGQRLNITVQKDLQTPSAPASNSSYKISRSFFQNLMLAIVAMVMSVMIRT